MGNKRKAKLKPPPKKELTDEEKADINNYMRQRQREYKKMDPDLTGIGITLKCKNARQKELINSIKDNQITIAAGPAGTGKTYLACAQALKLLKADERYDKIMLVKSVNGLEGEDLGFLPGDQNEKMHPYMMSFMANFYKIIGESQTNQLLLKNKITYAPLMYIRGANHDDAIILIDETQNITIGNIRTVMTRLGSNAKMVFLGDEKQIDLRKKTTSSLPYLIKNFKGLDDIGTIRFTKADIVRNPLIEKIEEVFDNNPY